MSEESGGVAVIGAGPAGLAAAWRLSSAGRVVVYESRSRPGGRLRTEEVAGARADAVVQLLSDGYTETLALLESMGLSDRVIPVPGRDALWRGGRAHPLRYGSVLSMAGSGALPTGLKLRLGLRYVPFLERHAGRLDMNAPSGPAAAGLDEESIADWGRRELGEDFVELMAYPLLASYYGVTPEETSAAFFHALARAGLHVGVLGVRGGFGPLAAAMAEALERRGAELRTGTTVSAVRPQGAGVRPGVEVELAGESRAHDAAVVAVPAPAAAGLLAGGQPEAPTRSTATLVLALDGPPDTGWFGLSIPRRAPPGAVLAAVCVQSEKATALGGTGDALVLIPAPAVGAEWAEADGDEVLSDALPALDAVLPGAGDRVVGARLIRLVDQVFVPAPGQFTSARAAAEPAPPGVALAGDYRRAPTVEGAVRSGLAAAEAVIRGGG